MKKKNEEKVLNEHVKKMLYRANYLISETPKYNPIIEDESEFDTLPVEIYNTQDGQPVPNPAGTDAFLEAEVPDDNADQLPGAQELAPKDPAEPSNAPAPDQIDVPAEVPDEVPEAPPSEVDVEVDAEFSPEEEVPVEEPEESVDEIQNEIIKHNISAMQSIHDKLEGLDQFMNDINVQLNTLNAKVEEVEEPTNVQKLVAQKDVSYPYYFSLNDYWKGGFFDQQREIEGPDERGMKELPDGTFIADFDDLPDSTDSDLDDSFNKIV